MPTFGYLIVKTFERLWLDFPGAQNGDQIYGIPIRDTPPSAAAKRYRGIDRNPLEAFSNEDFTKLKDPSLSRPEPEAQDLLAQMERDGSAEDGLIRRSADASALWSFLRESADHELIWARDYLDDEVDIPEVSRILGYEPSYLVSDHFSAIADCLFFPRWHGTDPEGVLFRAWYDNLNEDGLFDSPAQAVAFLDFYRSHDWTERGTWGITEVHLPDQP